MAAAQDVSPELLANLGFHNAADLEALRGFVGRPLGIMPRRSTRRGAERYPDIVKAGLEAVATVNNGNCFFAAISDQLYGNDSHVDEYRAQAVKYIRARRDHFMPFTVVKRGGGTREVAKRKNAGGYSISIDHGAASQEAIELQFDNRMAEMEKDRTYVDQQEVWALAAVLGINIRIFEPASTRDTDEVPGNGKAVAAIAYDPIGQHYSSVRRVGDPRTGPAFIEGRYEPAGLVESAEGESPAPSPKQILSPSDLLHPDQFARSRSSTPGSISIQRDNDDDTTLDNPPKRNATGRTIRSVRSRKPSKLSKKVSEVPTPSTLTSRATTPEAIIIVGEQAPEPEDTGSGDESKVIAVPPASPPTVTNLPSPPDTQAQSSSPSVVIVSDDESEREQTPLSPRKIAQRRRSSKREERERAAAALLATETAAEKDKKSEKKARGRKAQAESSVADEAPKVASQTRRGLRRGTRGRKAHSIQKEE